MKKLGSLGTRLALCIVYEHLTESPIIRQLNVILNNKLPYYIALYFAELSFYLRMTLTYRISGPVGFSDSKMHTGVVLS